MLLSMLTIFEASSVNESEMKTAEKLKNNICFGFRLQNKF